MLSNFALQEVNRGENEPQQGGTGRTRKSARVHMQPLKLPPPEMGRISAKEGVRNSIAGDQNTPGVPGAEMKLASCQRPTGSS
jgi:hypothetical protein